MTLPVNMQRLSIVGIVAAIAIAAGPAWAATAPMPAPGPAGQVAPPAKRPAHRVEVFQVRHGDIILQTNWGAFGPGLRTPADIALLDDPGLHGAAMFAYKIRDAQGRVVGFGAQQEENFLDAHGKPRGLWSTAWTVTIIGRGTLFLSQIESGSGLMAKIKLPADGSMWTGNETSRTTVGPRADGRGRIVGGTGEFEGRTGTFVEIDHAYSMDRDMKTMPAIDEELVLTYD